MNAGILPKRIRFAFPFAILTKPDTVRLVAGEELRYTLRSPSLDQWLPGFLRSFDLRPELPTITAPTLILGGRHDWICPPEFSEEIHRIIKGSQLRIFENSSHSIRNDEPHRASRTAKPRCRKSGREHLHSAHVHRPG